MTRRDAPWTDEEVARLRAWQEAGHVHPFTCPGNIGGANDGGICPSRELIPATDGWVCACGAYRQTWAFDFMVERGPPPDPIAALLKARDHHV